MKIQPQKNQQEFLADTKQPTIADQDSKRDSKQLEPEDKIVACFEPDNPIRPDPWPKPDRPEPCPDPEPEPPLPKPDPEPDWLDPAEDPFPKDRNPRYR